MDSTPNTRGDGAPAAPHRARGSGNAPAAEKLARYDAWRDAHRAELVVAAKKARTSLPAVLAVIREFALAATLARPTADLTVGQLEDRTGFGASPIKRALDVLTEAGALRTIRPAAGPGRGHGGATGRGSIRAVTFYEDTPTEGNQARERDTFTDLVDNHLEEGNQARERDTFTGNRARETGNRARETGKEGARARSSTGLPSTETHLRTPANNCQTLEGKKGWGDHLETISEAVARRVVNHELATGKGGGIKDQAAVIRHRQRKVVAPFLEDQKAGGPYGRWLVPGVLESDEGVGLLVTALASVMSGEPVSHSVGDQLDTFAGVGREAGPSPLRLARRNSPLSQLEVYLAERGELETL